MSKIEEAQKILKDLGLAETAQQISALTLLSLCDIKPDDVWQDAKRRSVTISNGIMDFARTYYGIDYKPNTRESFRKLALKPFIDNGITILNPDNPNLSPTSSKTHYAITVTALETVKKYNTSDWNHAVEKFRTINAPFVEEKKDNILLKKLVIRNFKSVVDTEIDLGRVNVFIGANGCGKTNILEALAFIGASRVNDLNFDGLYGRGVRIARPNLIASSFLNENTKEKVEILLRLDVNGIEQEYFSSLVAFTPKDIYSKWYDLAREEEYPETIMYLMQEIMETNPSLTGDELLGKTNELIKSRGIEKRRSFDNWLSAYGIYDLNTKSLRGITPPDSRKTPLGLNGEGLDSIISGFDKATKSKLVEYNYFDWLENVFAETKENEAYKGLKAGKSISNLYFTDKYMSNDNKTLSAENSNEGILHVLFYLSLFISDNTPKVFGIDNIETALNPRLCRVLIKELVKLSKEFGKQVLITTHNPAVLDGLNLFDEEQRLFEVYRTDEGHTQTRRIKFKQDLTDKQGKLSQMWLNGALGASPKNF